MLLKLQIFVFFLLEFAVLNQDWGLAFILALYMDSKTLNYVRSKYFQTIPLNDSLQTFFQLSSAKIPSSITVSKFFPALKKKKT